MHRATSDKSARVSVLFAIRPDKIKCSAKVCRPLGSLAPPKLAADTRLLAPKLITGPLITDYSAPPRLTCHLPFAFHPSPVLISLFTPWRQKQEVVDQALL
jgi:hypothetical protein